MRHKLLPALLALIFSVLLTVPTCALGAEYTARDIDDVIGGIADFKRKEAGCATVAEWLRDEAADGIGTGSEWYIIALSQYGCTDFYGCEDAVKNYLDTNKIPSASSREKFAMTLCAVGSGEYERICEILDSSVDGQGLMSRIFGLHLVTNGYKCRYTATELTDKLISMQLSDGGWTVVGKFGDTDATAMTVQALAPYASDKKVRTAIDRALDFLSSAQQSDGGFKSMGKANPESCAAVITALSALNIDCVTDKRFIKNGKNAIDAMLGFRLESGGFSHDMGGAFNDTATVQAFYSLIAYSRMTSGKGSLWIFDNRNIPSSSTVTTASSAVTTTVSASTESISVTTTAAVSSAAEAVSETELSQSHPTSSQTSASPSENTESVSAAETSTAEIHLIAADNGKSGGYKPIAIAVIIGAAGVLCLVLFATGKRNVKSYIAVAVITAGAVVLVLVTSISKPEDYYGTKPSKAAPVGTVTLSIRCDTAAEKGGNEYVPKDGEILAETAFEIEEGDTVYDILVEAARAEGIQLDASKSGYISGIAYIYEFDFGELSGWMFKVNGEFSSVGSRECVLNGGDKIEWLYTCDLGKDIGEVYENAQS